MDLFNRKNKNVKEIPKTTEEGLLNYINTDNLKRYTKSNINELVVVDSAIELIANTIAGLPIRKYREVNGKIERIEDKELNYLLNKQPCTGMTDFEIKKKIVRDILLEGKAYIYSPRGTYKTINIPTNVHKSTDLIDINTGLRMGTRYNFTINEVQLEKYDDELFEINYGRGLLKNQTWLNRIGMMCDYEYDVFKNGSFIPGVLGVEGINQEGSKNILKAIIDRIKDRTKKFVPVVVDGKLSWINLSRNPNDMLLDKIKEQTTREIEIALNLPSGFFSDKYNMELDEKMATFRDFTLVPLCTAVETQFTNSLSTYSQNLNGEFLMFDFEELDRGTFAKSVDALNKAVSGKLFTINEARAKLNKEAIKGGDSLDIGLGSALMDTETGKISVPNTGVNIDNTKDKELTKIEGDGTTE